MQTKPLCAVRSPGSDDPCRRVVTRRGHRGSSRGADDILFLIPGAEQSVLSL